MWGDRVFPPDFIPGAAVLFDEAPHRPLLANLGRRRPLLVTPHFPPALCFGTMDTMSDPNLPHGQLPPIPDGCGIMPIAENRIARDPHPELLDLVPEAYATGAASAPSDVSPNDSPLNDALEQTYRRVLTRALALAALALFVAAFLAGSVTRDAALQHTFHAEYFLPRAVFAFQIVLVTLCNRYVEKLSIAPAALLLFAYAGFCALEFSALFSFLPPTALAVGFLCAALMYSCAALWGFVRHDDLARPRTAIFMILSGGVILFAVNRLLHSATATWNVSAVAIVVFVLLASYHAEQIRDFYQEFDDDNAEGWKASVLGALLLLMNSVNVYLLLVSTLGRLNADDE